MDSSAPSILRPWFESQAHYECFHKFMFELRRVEKDENKQKKMPRMAHF